MLVNVMVPVAASAVVGANFTLKDIELFAFTLKGAASPLVVKSGDPLKVASDIDKAEPPELEIVIVCVLLLPTLTFPKAADTGFKAICGAAATTSAVTGMLNEEFDALLVKLMEPEADPMLVGVKATVMVSCVPPAKVAGVVSPLSVNNGLEVEPAEIVIVEGPWFVSVTVWCAVVPIGTLPNTMEARLLASWLAAPVSFAVFELPPNRAHPETKLASAKVAARAIQLRLDFVVFCCPRMSFTLFRFPPPPIRLVPTAPAALRLEGGGDSWTLVGGPKRGQLEHLYRGT